MRGQVDRAARALVTVSISGKQSQPKEPLQVWVDTAFNGTLVLPRKDIRRLDLQESTVAEAILADGNTIKVETFVCYLEWFGKTYRTQVYANDGEIPLLGTQLLSDRRLIVDYRVRSVELD